MQLTSAIVSFILALAAFVGATYHVIPASQSNHITTCGPTFGTGNNNTISICLDQFDQLLGVNDDKESDPVCSLNHISLHSFHGFISNSHTAWTVLRFLWRFLGAMLDVSMSII
ncbi:hypothetical protein BDQ17DRAFT_681679 [Cyathus striatus]|nr:hypothetical protein BDQ17DRAFT_681679 [Cyathus striatus]